MFVALVILIVALSMIAVELIRPGRQWPAVANWWLRAIGLNLIQASSVYLAGLTYDQTLPGRSLWQLDIGTGAGAFVGYLVVTFVYYWWHRWRHEVSFLWRWFHQVHHSPQRIEIITTFYKHPLEVLLNGVISSAILYVGVGLDPRAASQAVLLTGLAELFYHWNVRTPRWLGFVFQRPESHCVHHQQDLHSYNYSDLPIWDMMFGTFLNPQNFDAKCGFAGGREQQLGAMLSGVDVYADR